MEQAHGHPDVEEELRAHPVQGVLDQPEHGGADEGAGCQQHDHVRDARDGSHNLSEQAGPEDEVEVAQ